MSAPRPAVPFFARFLEPQEIDRISGGAATQGFQTEFPPIPIYVPKITKRFPSDTDDSEPLPRS